MEEKIFLNSFDGKKSVNTSNGVMVKFKGNKKLLSLNDVSEVISQYEQYVEERKKCNKIRLTCQVNALCSNVLFNKVTEIVKREGSSGAVNVNYAIGSDSEFDDVIYKPKEMEFWSSSEMKYQKTDTKISQLGNNRTAPIQVIVDETGHNSDGVLGQASKDKHPTNSIRDTQLSNVGFVYHCGLDFFNNHILRSDSFRSICKLSSNVTTSSTTSAYTAFNTIADLMRDVNGKKICEKYYFPNDANVPSGAKYVAMHMYNLDNIESFEDTVKNKLKLNYDGWVGFYNPSKIKEYKDFSNSVDSELNVERALMYYNSGDFVDMYPSRDLFSFNPKYNEYRHRIEKNWNYCITYPSSSYTPSNSNDQFSDIIETNNGVNSLKAIYFDENTRSDDGASQIVIYSISKHGLKVGDYVNIYKTFYSESATSESDSISAMTTQMVVENGEVTNVVDDYIFTVYNSYFNISDTWYYLSDDELSSGDISANGITYKRDNASNKFFFKGEDKSVRYYIVNGRYVNLDDDAQNISYKKVVGGVECDYYIRIFSKLPNFKYASANTSNEYELYKNDGETITKYQSNEYAFENHLSRLAFAKNIYGDDMSQIVFTDDIDLSYLKDNLGRPLSTLYLTIIKNNSGYKEWYGFGTKEGAWTTDMISGDSVEFSHCFGMVTCGIEASEESKYSDDTMSIKVINNISNLNGYDVSVINGGNERKKMYKDNRFELDAHEVSYEYDNNFYGDLCCYDGFNAIERPIQQILHRFNTAQRESINSESSEYFKNFVYDEIEKDDYDIGDEFIVKAYKYSDENSNVIGSLKEGYYYEPHYEIRIRPFGTVNTMMPDFLTIRQVNKVDNGKKGTYKFVTLQKHFLMFGDKAMLYDRINELYYTLKTIETINDHTFLCNVYLDSDNDKVCDIKYADTQHGLSGLTTKDEYYVSYKLFKMDNLSAPSYAKVLKDGTCRIIWRDLLNNGESSNNDGIEEYPFTNGAFYVNKKIDLYVKRQDPHNELGLYSEIDIIGNEMDISTENYYYKNDEIIC